jgi:hypothetical protein
MKRFKIWVLAVLLGLMPFAGCEKLKTLVDNTEKPDNSGTGGDKNDAGAENPDNGNEGTGDNGAGSLPKDLPVLITGGEADPVGAYGKGLREVADALRDAGMCDVTLKLYPEMRHEIHNELEKERVWEDLRTWILSKQP